MRALRVLALAASTLLPGAAAAHAQVGIHVQVGTPVHGPVYAEPGHYWAPDSYVGHDWQPGHWAPRERVEERHEWREDRGGHGGWDQDRFRGRDWDRDHNREHDGDRDRGWR